MVRIFVHETDRISTRIIIASRITVTKNDVRESCFELIHRNKGRVKPNKHRIITKSEL